MPALRSTPDNNPNRLDRDAPVPTHSEKRILPFRPDQVFERDHDGLRVAVACDKDPLPFL